MPDLSRGNANCVFGQASCNACVGGDILDTLRAVYAGSNGLNLYSVDFTGTRDNHIQGIARLPDVSIGTDEHGNPLVSGRIAITSNDTTGAPNSNGRVPGLWILEQSVLAGGSDPQAWRDGSIGWVAGSADLKDTGLDHPSGIQALGTMLVVAIENSGRSIPVEVRFYELSNGFDPALIQTLRFDGRYGSPAPITKTSAVAAVQLESGGYLLYVAGNDHGRAGGSFFVSNSVRSIGSDTEWHYVSSWTPSCTEARDGCFAGAGNMSFVVSCDGGGGENIWLLAAHGDWHISGPSDNYITLSRVTFSSSDGIGLVPLQVLQPETSSDGGALDISYRWAGNFFVTPTHSLMSDVSARNPSGVTAAGLHNILFQQFIPPGSL